MQRREGRGTSDKGYLHANMLVLRHNSASLDGVSTGAPGAGNAQSVEGLEDIVIVKLGPVRSVGPHDAGVFRSRAEPILGAAGMTCRQGLTEGRDVGGQRRGRQLVPHGGQKAECECECECSGL